MRDYVNVPGIIGAVISRNLATLHELDTVLSTEDLYDLIEIIVIDSYNQRIALNSKG